MKTYRIADLGINLVFPEWLIHPRLEFFTCEPAKADLTYRVQFKLPPPVPDERKPVKLKAYADSFTDSHGFLHIRNIDQSDIPCYTIISGDWSASRLYIDPVHNHNNSENANLLMNNLLGYMRELFIPSLIIHDGVLLHAASIDYNGGGVLFSAPAGTGKTTHVHLWREKYGVPILDGDVTACRMLGGSPYAYGLPWCGTSGEFMNKRLPLRAVVFLEQGARNEIRKLDIAEAVVRLYARCFLYMGTEEMTDQVLKTLENLAGSVDCYVLQCRPDFEAVDLVKQCLDKSGKI